LASRIFSDHVEDDSTLMTQCWWTIDYLFRNYNLGQIIKLVRMVMVGHT
jgi:hypothetical protein